MRYIHVNTDACTILLREREVARKSKYLGCFSTSLFSKQPIHEIGIKGMFLMNLDINGKGHLD